MNARENRNSISNRGNRWVWKKLSGNCRKYKVRKHPIKLKVLLTTDTKGIKQLVNEKTSPRRAGWEREDLPAIEMFWTWFMKVMNIYQSKQLYPCSFIRFYIVIQENPLVENSKEYAKLHYRRKYEQMETELFDFGRCSLCYHRQSHVICEKLQSGNRCWYWALAVNSVLCHEFSVYSSFCNGND